MLKLRSLRNLYARQPGRVLKRINAQQSEIVLDFLQKIPFFNSLKVFYLHLELPNDQGNSNDFAVERLWFGYREERKKEQMIPVRMFPARNKNESESKQTKIRNILL